MWTTKVEAQRGARVAQGVRCLRAVGERPGGQAGLCFLSLLVAPLGRGHASSPSRVTPVPPGGRREASLSFRLGPLLVCLRSLGQKSEGCVSPCIELSFPWFSEPKRGCKHEHAPRGEPQRALGAGSQCCVRSLWALSLPGLSARVSTAFCRASMLSDCPCLS